MPAPSKSSVSIAVDGRLHFGLISMHQDARRINGGVGLGVRGVAANVEASIADEIVICDERAGAFSERELHIISETLLRASERRGWMNGGKIRFTGELATHVGLGSGTALRLAALEALSLFNNDPLSQHELIGLSGRGGTSGIGIHSYFGGGLILDVGVVREHRGFVPSSQVQPDRVPSIIPRLKMPPWGLIACLPRAVAGKSQAEEVTFFSKTAPIPEKASQEAAYVALFDIYASAMDGDYAGFCRGIRRMQSTYWKAAELRQYDDSLLRVIDSLYDYGVDCAGLSSLGPTVFAFGSDEVLGSISGKAKELDCLVTRLSTEATGRRVASN